MDYKEYQTKQLDSNFWFRAKIDMIDKLISKYYLKRKDLKILNLGAGISADLKVLNEYGDVYVIDNNKDILDLIPKNLCFEKKIADACQLPYKNNFFDLVVSFDVFEHISDDFTAVSEVKRVLKEGGHLIFSVPAFQFLFSSHDRIFEHKRRYDKKMLKTLLSGFQILELNYWNFIPFFPMACMRLINKRTLNKEAKVNYIKLPRLINSFFFFILKTENQLISYNINPPIGLTLRGCCKK